MPCLRNWKSAVYMRMAIGCPMMQNVSQKITLPIDDPRNRRDRYLVNMARGTCPIIPKKDQGLTMWKGTLTMTSCMIADTKKTAKSAWVLLIPIRMQGKKVCRTS